MFVRLWGLFQSANVTRCLLPARDLLDREPRFPKPLII